MSVTEVRPDEPFELLQLLGVGGFAQTFKARILEEGLCEQWSCDEIVALKIPLNKKKERTLQKELEMNAILHIRLRDLQSANLVRYLGFCSFRNQIVMAMQFVSQGSLRKLLGDIGKQKPLTVDEALQLAEGVLAGLSAIHQEHVFHRDIKPENILLEGRIPKIADLGISRMLNSDELASTTTGTLYYMSPEILSEEGASFTSDIWSLGVTLYEMLTGQLPFGGRNTPLGKVMDLIRSADYVPPSHVKPDLPPQLDTIIGRALTRSPHDRYKSAEEMRQALIAFRQKKGSSRIDKDLEAIRGLLSTVEPSPEMEPKLKELMRKNPDEPRIYQYLGEYYNRCQRYGEAIDMFNAGIARNPDYALLYWDLALALQRKGQKREARKNLEQAVTLGLDPSLQRHATMLLQVLGK